ncbi:hypothetical protein PL373_09260 [Tenacibaculum maritimum]|nr:hypothetical protein [Tenacibaculum maritimum]MDB0601332.1 hypothetical protein [Tenacibaculum maritimum]MDB0611753.1 hypothetical protein [Tenacibaculum maritimum]
MKPIKIFIYSVLVFLVFIACASTQHKLVETSNIVKDTLYSKHDSVHIKTINQPINDVVFIPIETGNHKIDSVISKRFSNFKTYKKSGDNSYKIAYNKSSKGFDISSKIGQTENSLVKKLDSIKKVHRNEKKSIKTHTIIKYRIPKWFLIFFVISLISVYILSKLKVI